MCKKIGNNEKCPCGSGLKYKKCCRDNTTNKTNETINMKEQEWDQWANNLTNLPFRAEVLSEKGATGSLKVFSASITKDGVTTELFNDEITISTNEGESDKTENSHAIITIPQNKDSKLEITTLGNAYVKNNTPPYNISIKNNPKFLKLKSTNGLFAIINIVFRRDCGFNCFDLLFGETGREEIINESGIKQRPHLTIYPDGNNKFFRLVGYKCKMEAKLEYIPNNKAIFPIESKVVFDDYSEILVLSFSYLKENNTVELIAAEFK